MMHQTRNIIEAYKKRHDYLDYYKIPIEKVEENIDSNPDIAIESCKSLIEGVCKSIFSRLNSSKSEEELNSLDFPQLYRQTCWEINSRGPFETDFVHRTAAMIDKLAEIRNRRGDISHGKLAPKTDNSTKESAQMIMNVTDSIVHYMLVAYLSIDLSFKEEISYEDNKEFNEHLDAENPLDDVSYSLALFDQRPLDYELILSDWKLEREEEEETTA